MVKDAALATAMDTDNVLFAPSLDLFSVPSRAMSFLSISFWFVGSIADFTISGPMI